MSTNWRTHSTSATWRSAEDLVRRCNPEATSLLFDDVFEGLTCNRAQLEALVDGDADDVALGRELWRFAPRPDGPFVVVISDVTWKTGTPTLVSVDRLDSFIAEHADRYGEPLFSGDVLIIDLATPHIIGVHHDGPVLWFRLVA